MNDIINSLLATNASTLISDGALHEHLRKVLTAELTPRALRPRGAGIQALADEVVEQLVGRRSFDGVADLARALPLAVVPDLVGWPRAVASTCWSGRPARSTSWGR